jgi:LmbE family N-acetylglucosaminyl deacetylase
MAADLHGVLDGHRRDVRVTLVVAHPDDEILGAGIRLATLGSLTIVHVTDGSPLNLVDAMSHGFADTRSYARQRRRELQAALKVAGIHPHLVELGFPDQTATSNLSRVTMAVAAQFSRNIPELILTHPYEGGHPDHDATAFAVSAAAELVGIPHANIAEFTSYHAHNGELRSAEFLTPSNREIVYRLTGEEQAWKRRMLDCFTTQQETLSQFRTDVERFRPAPHYDFTMPPHAGQLWYERFPWGTTGDQFRRIAARVEDELESHLALAR